MKSKKSLLSLGILALVLVLGVGYAVVSSVSLSLGGTASVENANLKVAITDVEDSKSSATINVSHNLESLSDTFTISNMKLNDSVTMTYTITNQEVDVAAKILAETITNTNTEHFTVQCTVVDEVINANDQGNATGTVTVFVRLNKTPLTEEQGKVTITVPLTASAVENVVQN